MFPKTCIFLPCEHKLTHFIIYYIYLHQCSVTGCSILLKRFQWQKDIQNTDYTTGKLNHYITTPHLIWQRIENKIFVSHTCPPDSLLLKNHSYHSDWMCWLSEPVKNIIQEINITFPGNLFFIKWLGRLSLFEMLLQTMSHLFLLEFNVAIFYNLITARLEQGRIERTPNALSPRHLAVVTQWDLWLVTNSAQYIAHLF